VRSAASPPQRRPGQPGGSSAATQPRGRAPPGVDRRRDCEAVAAQHHGSTPGVLRAGAGSPGDAVREHRDNQHPLVGQRVGQRVCHLDPVVARALGAEQRHGRAPIALVQQASVSVGVQEPGSPRTVQPPGEQPVMDAHGGRLRASGREQPLTVGAAERLPTAATEKLDQLEVLAPEQLHEPRAVAGPEVDHGAQLSQQGAPQQAVPTRRGRQAGTPA